MIKKQFLALPESPSSFESLIDAKGYFVDKTEFLKTLLTDSSSVLVFIRPSVFLQDHTYDYA